MKTKIAVLTTVILLAALTRLIPHPFNFTPITAIALFGGVHFSNRLLSFFVPLAALFLSDLVIGFYSHMWVIYLTFTLIICLGQLLRPYRSSPGAIVGGALVSSVVFFLLTNIVGICGDLYPVSFQGMIASYTAAIPFFKNTLMGDLFYTALLFGGYAIAEKQFLLLQESSKAV